MRRIAVAIDFSIESEKALGEAIVLGRKLGAEVHMVHVVAEYDADDKLPALRDLDRAHRTEVHEMFAELHQRFDGRGVELSQVVVDGSAAPAICQAADQLDCDIIVVGTHGRTGIRRFFLGSVAEKVARTARRDVLVSRGEPPLRGYRRVLVPTDFSKPAERALARAVELAADKAEIDLFHVRQLPGSHRYKYAPFSSYPEALKEISASMRVKALERAAPLLSAYEREGVRVVFDSVNGDPSTTIAARAAGSDLIVMGTQGRRGLTRFVLGSVAERTIRHAPCSVLVTHAREE